MGFGFVREGNGHGATVVIPTKLQQRNVCGRHAKSGQRTILTSYVPVCIDCRQGSSLEHIPQQGKSGRPTRFRNTKGLKTDRLGALREAVMFLGDRVIPAPNDIRFSLLLRLASFRQDILGPQNKITERRMI